MKKEKRHVGRPTNEEVKIRQNKKLLNILIPILLIIVLLLVGMIIITKRINTVKLLGNTYKYPSVVINLDSFKALDSSPKAGQCLLTAARYKDVGKNVSRVEWEGKEIGGSEKRGGYAIIKKLKKNENYYIDDIDSGFRMYLPKNSKFQFTLTTYSTNQYGYNDLEAYQAKWTFFISKDCKVSKKSFDGSKYYTSNLKKNGIISSSSPSSNSSLKIICPTTAKVNEEFTCKTNEAQAVISVTANGLASGYSTSFSTTDSDKTKQSKYTKPGTVTIKVSKDGYKSVTKTVKIVSNNVTTKNVNNTTKNVNSNNNQSNLRLDCPTTAKVNEAFKCTTNMDNVIITISGCNLATNYNSSFTS